MLSNTTTTTTTNNNNNKPKPNTNTNMNNNMNTNTVTATPRSSGWWAARRTWTAWTWRCQRPRASMNVINNQKQKHNNVIISIISIISSSILCIILHIIISIVVIIVTIVMDLALPGAARRRGVGWNGKNGKRETELLYMK